jgi:hypothetical protein
MTSGPTLAAARFSRVSVAAVCIILIASVYVVPNVSFLFHGNQIEFGDFANNALRITNAKRFAEIYGNHSRWGFYHPGPAFWYLYAAGEYLFHDWLGVSSPHAAHVLIGIVFQVTCAVAALLYLGRKTSLTVVPIAIALLFVHWNSMLGAPNSIWPPHVLFGPFLLLITFGAGVASGDVKFLPIMIFAGGLLLHGHVAQPLLVIPLGCLALISVVRSGRYKEAHLSISALILAVFMLPIIIDTLRGSQSNIATIFHHIKTHAGEHHTLSQGVGYFLSFFLYEEKQQIVQGSATFSLTSYLWSHPTLWLAMALVAACAVTPLTPAARFVKCYSAFVAIAVVVSVVWSTIQDGEMFEFNGNFIYAVVYLLYLFPWLIAASASLRIRYYSYILAGSLVAVAALWNMSHGYMLSWKGFFGMFIPKPIFTIAVASDEFDSELKAMTRGAKGVYVSFKPARQFEALAVINQINRLGIPYRVQDGYSFLYTTRVRKHEPELSIEVCGDSGPILPHPASLPGSQIPCHITVTSVPTGPRPNSSGTSECITTVPTW